jgi:uncharacterized protein with HEPN domain
VRADKLYLADILESCQAALSHVSGRTKEQFVSDRMLHGAVLRELGIIGEAAARVSEDLRAAHPEVNWRAIARFRNVVVHQYFSIDLDLVWNLLADDVPKLQQR